MAVQLGQYPFYKPATFKIRRICITTKYRPIYKIFGLFWRLCVVLKYWYTSLGTGTTDCTVLLLLGWQARPGPWEGNGG